MGLKLPEISTLSQTKKAAYKKFINNLPKDVEIKFHDNNKKHSSTNDTE